MITVDLAIIHPATGESLTGKISFTPTSAHAGQVITHDGAVVSGMPVTVDLAEQSSVTLHPSPPGWWYTVRGKDETGYTFTDHRAVPSQLPDGQESIALTELRKINPRAGGLSVTPDPEWQAWAREIIALGGIPGESAKEAAEKVEGTQLTDQEFITLITGPRGEEGPEGPRGEQGPEGDPGVEVDTSVGTKVSLAGVVAYYNSGKREVSSELINGWTAASVIIWRENSLVNLLLYGLDPSAATAESFISLPTGFGVANANAQTWIKGEQVTIREWEADITISVNAAVVGTKYNGVLITWPAVDSKYPTSEFGTAV